MKIDKNTLSLIAFALTFIEKAGIDKEHVRVQRGEKDYRAVRIQGHEILKGVQAIGDMIDILNEVAHYNKEDLEEVIEKVNSKYTIEFLEDTTDTTINI